MSRTVLVLMVTLALLPLASVVAQDDPVLTSATASFHTNGDDKNADTALTISVEKGPNEYAIVDGINGQTFNDHSDNGPFELKPEGTVHKSALQNATTTLKIVTHGDDTWQFNYFLTLEYSDGSRQRFQWFTKQLKENNNILTLPLQQ